MPKIIEMFAFVAEDSGPSDEGVVGMKIGDEWAPMVGADMARVESLKPIAKQIRVGTGKKITLVRFTQREDLEVI